MDDEKVKKLEHLLTMFDARDAMWSKHTRQIASVINPTVLDALRELFDVPSDDIEWMDLQIVETVLVIVCNITYDPMLTSSVLLQRVDQAQRPNVPIRVQRLLRIGIPLAVVFSSKEEVIEFLTKLPVETTDDEYTDDVNIDDPDLPEYEGADADAKPPTSSPAGVAQVMGFDTSDLSEDQIKSLMLYRHASEATKQ